MRQKQAKTNAPMNNGDISPQQHNRELSQNHKKIVDILQKFQGDQPIEIEQQKLPLRGQGNSASDNFLNIKSLHDKERDAEDIADDSDEEKSIKDINVYQIKSLEVGAGIKGFAKNFSEHDFLHKELLKKNKNLIVGNQGSNKIQLIVRIRPFLVTEQAKECLKVVNDNGIRLFKDFHQIHFKFDNILMPKDPQDVVFSRISNIIQGFLVGLSGTIFAYGQTGAGKTYSIMGGEERGEQLKESYRRGILPRTIDSVFQKLEYESSNTAKVTLFVSFYEIYNEKIYDLLCKSNKKQNQNPKDQNKSSKRSQSRSQIGSIIKEQPKPQNNLDIREEKDGKFSIPDLIKAQISNIEEAYEQLERGLQKRQTSSTSLNNQSSRSHSIFQLYMEKYTKEGTLIKSKIRIVDLAGSEKYTIKKDLPVAEKNQKVQELTSINSSLSALGQCISALSDPLRKHIPYRNSKLTKVLKDSLDESSNLALIICISPSVDSYKETLSTLQFADRAKKAILDGRNFSDSKLLQDFHPNSDSINNILKAYQEEKAIRKELEMYMKENNQLEVFEELDRLKKQNKELQDKVKQLELNKAVSETELGVGIQQKQLKSCLKKENVNHNVSSQSLINIKIVQKQMENEDIDEEDDPNRKRVRFAEKLDNDQSLDSDDRERIEHNLKYNDDTIFDNISIFRDLNNSGLTTPHRLVDRKDVHPSRLKTPLPIEDDEDEDEEEEKNVVVKVYAQEEIKQLESNKKNDQNKSSEGQNRNSWLLQSGNKNSIKPINEYNINEDNGVSPIQKKKPNNSDQDLSKDLIDLDNDQQLKNLEGLDESKISHCVDTSDKTGSNKNITKIKLQNFLFTNVNQQESIFDQVETPEINTNKNYQICDGTDRFFDTDYDENRDCVQGMIIGEMNFQNNQILSDSIIGLDAAIERENIPSIQIMNTSQDNQNTLLLDSQSMIIEDPMKDQNMSQQMLQSLEASSILQQRDANQQQNNHQNQQQQQCFYSVGNLQAPSQFVLQGGMSSNANSSNQNTDVLTYSLTNTFSTIESLHDELTAIRNGLELSQKRGANILKTIHQYAREIEDNRVLEFQNQPTDYKTYQDEELKSLDGINLQDEDKDNSNFDIENNNFINDIKGFYSKIHQEINQLKNILIDSTMNNQSDSPQPKRLMNDQQQDQIATQRQNFNNNSAIPQQTISRNVNDLKSVSADQNIKNQAEANSMISIEGIEKTQQIINQLRKEMEVILNINPVNTYKRKRNERNQTQKSLKVLDLLEALQNSLVSSVINCQPNCLLQITPAKAERSPMQLSSEKKTIKKQQSDMKQESRPSTFAKMSSKKFEYNYENQRQKSPLISSQNERQPVSPLYLKNIQGFDIEMSDKQVVSGFMQDQNNHQKTKSNLIMKQEEMIQSSIQQTQPFVVTSQKTFKIGQVMQEHQQIQPTPLRTNLRISTDNPVVVQNNQRTPEIFKSLAKLDESDQNINSIIDQDFMFSSSQNNMIPTTQMNNFFSQQSQNAPRFVTNNNENQDMQITLRSYNMNDQIISNNSQSNNVNTSCIEKDNQIPTYIPNQNIGKKSILAPGANPKEQMGTDHTLTLIFDSEDEEFDENDDKFDEPEIQEIAEGENEDSIIFNDNNDSKIERNSSVGNGSRLNNNLITSSSFQGDNSLLIFANNFINAGIDNNSGELSQNMMRYKNQNSYNRDDQNSDFKFSNQDNQQIRDLKSHARNKQDISSNLLSNQLGIQHYGHNALEHSQSNLNPDKKSHNKYLLPQKRQASVSFGQNTSSSGAKTTQILATNHKPFQDYNEQRSLTEQDQNDGDQFPLSRNHPEIQQKSTSKTSVQKYWNQFFNNNKNNTSLSQSPHLNISQSLVQPSSSDQSLQQKFSINQMLPHNQEQHHLFGAHNPTRQSNSFKDDNLN
ncbi:UNKNOWN [Stylonychia lemnae]|uniref:Kinesin motor domain-containing protein n=1 Tax=Stylonychia lemnae TaxID=5949 RepID=A0A078A878_STYLE|nr:UNKNOWN [Stylonychia lemnae]|eukprot:CDW76981.1 UNKNOWN [Stylonychia lemnae]